MNYDMRLEEKEKNDGKGLEERKRMEWRKEWMNESRNEKVKES